MTYEIEASGACRLYAAVARVPLHDPMFKVFALWAGRAAGRVSFGTKWPDYFAAGPDRGKDALEADPGLELVWWNGGRDANVAG